MASIKLIVSVLTACALLLGAAFYIAVQVSDLAEMSKSLRGASKALYHAAFDQPAVAVVRTLSNAQVLNSTRADSFQLRGAAPTCNASDVDIYNRDSAICVSKDPFMGSCLETQFDNVVSGQCENTCAAAPGNIDPATGKVNEQFSGCVSECVVENEKLSKPCADCFGKHNWVACTQRKTERAMEVCKTDMVECAKVLLERCLPNLQDCTGMKNATLPHKRKAMDFNHVFKMPKPHQSIFNNATPKLMKSRSEVRKEMMDRIKIPSMPNVMGAQPKWFPKMSEKNRIQWDKLFPKMKEAEEHSKEESSDAIYA